MEELLQKKHRLWLSEYLENNRQNNKSEKTIVNYRADLVKFLVWFECHYPHPIHKAKSSDISLYLQFLNGKKVEVLTPWWNPFILRWKKKVLSHPNLSKIKLKEALSVASRRRHLSALHNFFEFLKQTYEDKGIFKTNPIKLKIHNIKMKDVDQGHTVLLTEQDWNAIMEVTFRIRDKLILSLMYFGGLRLEEVVNLNINCFNFQEETITFLRKGGSMHELRPDKSAFIFSLLAEWLVIRTHYGDALFVNQASKRISTRGMYALVMALIKKSNCPSQGLSPHSFRKGCATRLYDLTKDLLYVRDYLNHSDAKVTQGYIQNPFAQKNKQASHYAH